MNRKYLVASALLIGMAAPLSAQSVIAGIDAWQRSDYAGAVAIWRPLAEKGDADAEFNLGQAYRLGRGVPTNLAAAKIWFERSAKQGHIDAETTLGLLLFEAGDQPSGLKWLKKAADQAEPRAMLVYGTALVNGDSVPQDPILGYAYVSRAAAQGLAPAKQTLDQLDQMLPLADRRRGVQIASDLAKAAPAPSSPPIQSSASARSPAPAPSPPPAAKTVEAAAAKPPAKPATAPKAAPAARVAENSPPKASPPPAPSGNWRIQLGAFSQKGNAEALYRKVSGKSVLAGRKPVYAMSGSVTRLQVGPFESKSAAESACRSLAVACFAVPAK
ncbi:MAG TPA: SPOR domain-containing protein [Sphingomicrobium sp.]|jgi:cell division septation protein DedD|nr:SPOR domain-containing protein [Sphingomicrobium sp.]